MFLNKDIGEANISEKLASNLLSLSAFKFARSD